MLRLRAAAGACFLATVLLAGFSTLLHPWPVPEAGATAEGVLAAPGWEASHVLLAGMAAAAVLGTWLLHRALRRRAPAHRDDALAAAGAVLVVLGFAVIAGIAGYEAGPFQALAADAPRDATALHLFAAAYDAALRLFDGAVALAALGSAAVAWALAAGAVVEPHLARGGAGASALAAAISAASAVAPTPLPIWLGAAGMALYLAWLLALGLALVGQGVRGALPRRPGLPEG